MRRLLFLALVGPALLAGCSIEPPDERVGVARQAQSVDEAAGASCSTTAVKGLSEQIVAQGNCNAPGAFVAVPAPSNVTYGSSVFAYLEQPAKDAFLAAADESGMHMSINSMLRTVAQQYLLYRWYQTATCGIGLAAPPSTSNHESGLAFDVEEYAAWKSALEAHGFVWFGASDPVHYDYEGTGSVDHRGVDVLAFQQLWNKNHPNDTLSEDGEYGPATEARLKQAPADGFAMGASCEKPGQGPDVWPAIATDAPDLFSDHASKGVPDMFVGDVHTMTMDVVNKGNQPANPVDVAVTIDEPYLVATSYEIQSDYQHPGQFSMNEANDDPENPPRQKPGSAFTLHVHQLSPGETKRVRMSVAAKKYSIAAGDPPFVRFWVKSIPGVYEQSAFDTKPKVSKGQTFHGGVLQVAEKSDVYSHTSWEWNTDRLEGWSPSGDASLAADGKRGLLLGSMGSDPGALGPATQFSGEAFKIFSVRMKRTGGAGDAKMYFATSADPEIDEAKVVPFSVPDDDTFHVVDVDMSKNARWGGKVTGLRLDPFASKMGSVEIDYLRFQDGGQGGGGGKAPSGASSEVGAGGGNGDGSGCAVGPAGVSDAGGGAASFMLALAFARLRRDNGWRRRSNSSSRSAKKSSRRS